MTSDKSNESLLNKEKLSNNGFLETFITTFTTVFIAELGDKTQIATLLLSADTGKPLYVFTAAALALVLSSLIGVILGTYISSKISQNTFNKVAGSIMICISLYIFFNVFKIYFF